MIAHRRNIAEQSIRHPAGLDPGPALGAILCLILATTGVGESRADANTAPTNVIAIDLTGNDSSFTHTASQRADQVISYSISMSGGGTYLIVIDQGGLDLVVTIEDPTGTARTFNSPLLRDEQETILLEDSSPGRYELSLSSTEHTGAVSNHTFEIRRVGIETESDAESVVGWRLLTAGAEANAKNNRTGWENAISAYRAAAQVWEQLADQHQQARALYSEASIEYWQLMNWDRSASLAAAAAALYKRIGVPGLHANAIHLEAAAIIEKANEIEKSPSSGIAPEAEIIFSTADQLFKAARTEQLELGNTYETALSTNNLGLMHYYMGEWSIARNFFDEAAAMFREQNEWSGELMPLSNLAVIDWEQGYLRRAVDTFQRLLEIIPPGKFQRYRADILDNLAGAQLTFGNINQALQAFSKALSIHEEINNLKGQGRSLSGIGITYYSIGEFDLARDYLTRALPIRTAANDGRGQASVLRYLGNIESYEHRYAEALQYHNEALPLATSPADRAKVQILIGYDLAGLGQFEESIGLLKRARDAVTEANHPPLLAESRQALGRSLAHAGQPDEAIDELTHALEFYEQYGLEMPVRQDSKRWCPWCRPLEIPTACC